MLYFIDKGFQIWTSKQNTLVEPVLIELINYKGDALKKIGRYDEAIHAYLQLLSYSLPN